MKPAPELLAPAGDLDAARAAFAAGADAVYAGLPRFNARERGDNFTPEGFLELVQVARGEGRRVYLTLNTLVAERELPAVAELLFSLAPAWPDAVIVQDLGVLRLLREHLPHLPVHASTQAAVHNSAGVDLLGRLGVSRVILERQVTLDELAGIAQATTVELEVFVHGALCCCLSGSCLFSSWIGGWSGNRGKCKQPCRRRYHGADGNGFFFSTQDLYALDVLPVLRDLGIASLKIEGRLRQSDYVQSVVAAYRLVLDTPGADGAVLKEARRILSQSCGRRWSPGFRTETDFTSVVDHRSMGVSGLLCGEVTGVRQNGFEVRLSAPLVRDDRIRVQGLSGDQGPSMTITRLSVRGRSVERAARGGTCFVHADKAVKPGDRVFKTGRSVAAPVEDRLPFPRWVVDLAVWAVAGRLCVSAPAFPSLPSWQSPVVLSPARKRPLTAVAVQAEFARVGSESLMAGGVRAEVGDEWFASSKQLRQLRQAFWAWAEAAWPEALPAAVAVARERVCTALGAGLAPAEGAVRTTVLLRSGAPNPVAGAVVARPLGMSADPGEELLLPHFVSEGELAAVTERIVQAVAAGHRVFRATSLGTLALLFSSKSGAVLTVRASFALPVCNHLAVAVLRDLGVASMMAWPELDRTGLEDLAAAAPGWMEVYSWGRLPLLVTRARLAAAGAIVDSRGAAFDVAPAGNLTAVYPRQVFACTPLPGVSRVLDLALAELGEAETSDFNLGREWV